LQSDKSKDCKRFVVGDLAPEIWALWKGIQENPKEVYSKALTIFDEYMKSYNSFKADSKNSELLAVYEAEGRELWKYLQTVDTSKLSLSERAARTWVTNRISFSGMGDSGSLSVDRLSSFDKEHAKKILDVKIVNEDNNTETIKPFFVDDIAVTKERDMSYAKKDEDIQFEYIEELL